MRILETGGRKIQRNNTDNTVINENKNKILTINCRKQNAWPSVIDNRPNSELRSVDSNIKDAKKFNNLVRKERDEVMFDIKTCQKNDSKL